MFIEASAPRIPGDTADFVSEVFERTTGTGRCLRFWYHMSGAGMGTLNIYLEKRRTVAYVQAYMHMFLSSAYPPEAIPLSYSTTPTTTAPSTTSANPALSVIFCNFDQSLCSFTQSRTDDFDWSWNTAGTSSTGTGTLANQWYEASVNVKESSQFKLEFTGVRGVSYMGDIALDDISMSSGLCSASLSPTTLCTFESPVLCNFKQDATDDFDWSQRSGSTSTSGTGPTDDHTYGSPVGAYIYIEANGESEGNVARLISPSMSRTSGSCVEFWYHMYGKGTGNLTVSTVGSSYTGDIAVDDVIVKDGGCGNPTDCNFEQGLCLWRNENSNDDFDWLLGTGSTTSRYTGPTVDHTIGTDSGSYLFMEASAPRRPGDVTQLINSAVNLPSDGCFVFWYHMFGGNIGTLSIYDNTKVNAPQLLWAQSGDKQDNWLNGRVPLNKNVKSVMIQATRGLNHLGDIAIDDILVVTSPCTLFPSSIDVLTTAPTTPATTKKPFG
ncbi:hypothetical protein EB796_023000 [Bugula neritina]|uniref:MAM domain-containing protein n=1 Tax=Bugula neritina TaxID=10212 RepID=A0A7J7IXP7_BUGNE|nr:hypothetical protein EB796_023000 [Bugula neritina]